MSLSVQSSGGTLLNVKTGSYTGTGSATNDIDVGVDCSKVVEFAVTKDTSGSYANILVAYAPNFKSFSDVSSVNAPKVSSVSGSVFTISTANTSTSRSSYALNTEGSAYSWLAITL